MNVSLIRGGLYVILRYGNMERTVQPLGFVVKPASQMLFSERHGGWRGMKVGPVYFRTYERRPIQWPTG